MATVVPSPVGYPVPCVEHAISVSLPTWSDTLRYKRNEEFILSRMKTGYPRYFIHLNVRELAAFFEAQYGEEGERALLVRSPRVAEACCAFVNTRITHGQARVLECLPSHYLPQCQVHVVLFPAEAYQIARKFWQWTGLGISSRIAKRYMTLRGPSMVLPSLQVDVAMSEEPPPKQRHVISGQIHDEIPLVAKNVIRERIAGLVNNGIQLWLEENGETISQRPSEVTTCDVFLYPMGMSAIWSVHQLCMCALGEQKSVCLGFPYTDTLKILQNWGPGCYFYPDVEESTIDELELLLESLQSSQPSRRPILSLFTEFPSNPLLHSVNLPRLRKLADKYDFLIVIDETVGNFANVQVLTFADAIVTSLSKLFSGSANVTGGSLVLNPAGKHYAMLKAQLERTYEDIYFNEDAKVMEMNSRDFEQRSAIINDNTEAICDYLTTCSPVVTKVYYPKLQREKGAYDMCRIGGYGGLFSLLFASPAAAHAFYDALTCAKGPSLGTNFTLACAYTLLAHFYELEWAAEHGVPEALVRVSVGMENKEELLDMVRTAVKSAEEAHLASV